uniref:Uncharacterized protein n=1 Tax=Anguilla anguilla TaxID=7936 RepID=A0A0E9VBQ8_ANGAN
MLDCDTYIASLQAICGTKFNIFFSKLNICG